jgi:predicted TIM-barrel fold metal-dependent hydrolase
MVIDCHYHLDEQILTIDEMIKKMDESGIDKTVLMGKMIDPFTEPGHFLVRLLQFFLKHSITRPLGKLFVTNFTPDGEIKILGKPMPIYPDPDNAPIYEAVEKHPDRFLAWTFVNPRGVNDPVQEYDRWRNKQGFAGAKGHPMWHQYPPVELAPVAERCVEDGKPLIIHAGFGDIGDFFSLLKEVPRLKLILAHAGFPGYSDTWKRIRNNKNIYVDISQTTYVGAGIVKNVVEYLGADRCLYGTDGPYGFHDKDEKFDYSIIKKWVELPLWEEKTQRRILGENFLELIQ